MHPSCLEFVSRQLDRTEVRDKTVLEVGSRNVAGDSVRPTITALAPRTYVGVDIEAGENVDELCDAEKLRKRFGDESFDIVVSTEMLEHVRDWRIVVSNLKNVARSGGLLVLTTRSFGFPYHGWPSDYWRYEIRDMETIFSDLTIVALEADPLAPGVFLKAVKPQDFRELDLSNLSLFSVVKRRRTARIVTERDARVFAVVYSPIRLVRAACPQLLKDAVKRTALSRERRALARTSSRER